jgi:hypothetical protein
METIAAQETATQVPAVLCGPTADVALFVAVAMAAFGLYSIYKLLTRKGGSSIPADERSSQSD